jgi:bifunctional DNase/RNase
MQEEPNRLWFLVACAALFANAGCKARSRPAEPALPTPPSSALTAWIAPSASAPDPAPPSDIAKPAPPPGAPKTIPAGYWLVRVAGVTHMPGGGNAVLLVDDGHRRALPIFIGGTEALSIELRLKKQPFVRPLTHDLFDRTIQKLGGKVDSVRVDKIENNTFYGTVLVNDGKKIFELDARPSDAIALAIGNGVPIHVAAKVLDASGMDLDKIHGDPADEIDIPAKNRPDPITL